MPVDDYPKLPTMPTTAGTVDSAEFATAVGQVAVAAGRDDTLPMLTGVRLEIDGEKLTLAATDRYRLAVRELDVEPVRPGEAVAQVADSGAHARRRGEEPRRTSDDADDRAVRSAGAGEGIIGFSGTTGGRASRATTRLLDATVPAVPHAAAHRVGVHRRGRGRAARRGGQAGRPGRRPQHARSGWSSPTARSP